MNAVTDQLLEEPDDIEEIVSSGAISRLSPSRIRHQRSVDAIGSVGQWMENII